MHPRGFPAVSPASRYSPFSAFRSAACAPSSRRRASSLASRIRCACESFRMRVGASRSAREKRRVSETPIIKFPSRLQRPQQQSVLLRHGLVNSASTCMLGAARAKSAPAYAAAARAHATPPRTCAAGATTTTRFSPSSQSLAPVLRVAILHRWIHFEF